MNAPPDAPALRTAPTVVRYVVLGALCVATTIAYIDRGCMSVAIVPIQTELDLTDGEVGSILSAFFLAYTVFQLPSGWLGHVWGSRRALPFFCTLWSAATGIGAAAKGVPLLAPSRVGLGAAEAGVFPSATSTIAQWYPATRRALVSGLLGSCMGIGAALGALLTGVLLDTMTWRSVLLIYTVPGVLWAVWFYLWFRDRPEEHSGVNAAELALIRGGAPAMKPESEHAPTPWGTIFTSVPMWWINGQQFFKAAGYVFYLSWFPKYLQMTHGVNIVEAGILTSLPHWALTISPIMGGWLSDELLVRTGNRRLARQWLSAVTLILCGVFILLAYPIPNAWLAVSVISIGAFFAGLSGPCAYALCMDMGGKHVAPVFSTMNMAGNVGAVLFPLLVPAFVKLTGSWESLLFPFAGFYLASGLCWLPFNSDGHIVPVAPDSSPPDWDEALKPWDPRTAGTPSTDIIRPQDKD